MIPQLPDRPKGILCSLLQKRAMSAADYAALERRSAARQAEIETYDARLQVILRQIAAEAGPVGRYARDLLTEGPWLWPSYLGVNLDAEEWAAIAAATDMAEQPLDPDAALEAVDLDECEAIPAFYAGMCDAVATVLAVRVAQVWAATLV